MSDETENVTDFEAVRSALAGETAVPATPPAAEEGAAGGDPAGDPHAETAEDGDGGRRAIPLNEFGLPESCPIVPIGIAGDELYFLDETRQLRSINFKVLNRSAIISMFGRQAARVEELWPRFKAVTNKETQSVDWIHVGWRPEQAQVQLTAAASSQGVWNPKDKLRQAGAWKGPNGELVLHCGDIVLATPAIEECPAEGVVPLNWWEPGLIGGKVYPACERIPAPSDGPVAAGEDGPAAELLTLFRTWPWRRPIDAMLLLGWVGAAMVGGALKWRPMAWITGGPGSGKSTLQEILKYLLGEGLISVTDATAAGIWQALGHASVPVAFDEIEAEQDNRQAMKVVKLARQAASGGLVVRGGDRHQGHEFRLNCSFLFSSVMTPPLQAQDRSRIAMLELGRLPGGPPPKMTPRALRKLGKQLRRRLVDAWPRLERTVECYRLALLDGGHTARGADQYGTLLGCADVLLSDGEPVAELMIELVAQLEAAEMAAESESDQWHCWTHLASQIIEPYRSGTRKPLGAWLATAADLHDAEAAGAARALETYGLKLVWDHGRRWLVVANSHASLRQLFAGTHWEGASGSVGLWVQSLRRLEGAERYAKAVWMAGVTVKGTWVPLEKVVTRPADTASASSAEDGGDTGASQSSRDLV